jgi:hypothetical protein
MLTLLASIQHINLFTGFPMLAEAAVFRGMGIGQIAKYVIIVAAIIAVVYVALNYFEIAIPPFAIKIF